MSQTPSRAGDPGNPLLPGGGVSSEPAYADALPTGTLRGRGSNLNPGNRFEPVRLHVLGDELDRRAAEHPGGLQQQTAIYADRSRSIINPVDSPDLGFKWTINPYRGCEHGCIYCYARPGHEYLSLSSGIDFETKIFAKHDAPALLRHELAAPSWKGEGIMLSGVTDPYQPVERHLQITRRCLEVLAEHRQAVSLITKNKLITRDLDVLAPLIKLGAVHAAVSITTLEPDLAAKMEPRASSPRDRLETVRRLTDAGIPVRVMVAPVIPAINDREIADILHAARQAGALNAGFILLRLPFQIKSLFLEWLARHYPDRAAHVESLIRASRAGELYDARFFKRQRGEGPYAQQINASFKLFSRRLGLDKPSPPLNTTAFTRPRPAAERHQLGLFT